MIELSMPRVTRPLSMIAGLAILAASSAHASEENCLCLIQQASDSAAEVIDSVGTNFVKRSKGYDVLKSGQVVRSTSEIVVNSGGALTVLYGGNCQVKVPANFKLYTSNLENGGICVRHEAFRLTSDATYGQTTTPAARVAGVGTGLGNAELIAAGVGVAGVAGIIIAVTGDDDGPAIGGGGSPASN